MIENETLKIIKQRRSIRSYKDSQITDEELQAVLEAGIYAPNAGEQVWHFTAIQNKEMLQRLNLAVKEAARESDKDWLRKLGNDEGFNCLYGAPTLIIVSGDSKAPTPLDADCAAALQSILLAAESMGLSSCWIFFVLLALSSPQGAQIREELKMPEGFRPYYSAVIGYRNIDIPEAPERKPGLVTYIK